MLDYVVMLYNDGLLVDIELWIVSLTFFPLFEFRIIYLRRKRRKFQNMTDFFHVFRFSNLIVKLQILL